jgi:adenine-specific DNA-methyltransferase
MEAILKGENLPSYEDLARYLFFTATGELFDPSVVDYEHHFIGSSRDYDVFLFYKPDLDYLKTTALTLEKAEEIARITIGSSKKRLVFAPMKFLDQDYLDKYRIDFVQLPYEIYRMKG